MTDIADYISKGNQAMTTETTHKIAIDEVTSVATHFHGVATRAHERGEWKYSLKSKAIAAVDRALQAVWGARKNLSTPMTDEEFNDFLMGNSAISAPDFEQEERDLNKLRNELSALT